MLPQRLAGVILPLVSLNCPQGPPLGNSPTTKLQIDRSPKNKVVGAGIEILREQCSALKTCRSSYRGRGASPVQVLDEVP